MSNTALPLISVIVPVYNVKPYIAKCLDSIMRQTYTNIEIIVVDDGSTDGSEHICDEYANKDQRIIVIHQKNGGLAAARNTGIDAAHGEYLGFVDSDDFIEPFMYEKLLNAAQQNSCTLAVCGINYVFDDGKVIPKANIEPNQVFDFPRAITEMNTYRLFDMGAWSKLYKSNLFDDIRFPIGKLSEDFFIMFKIFDRAQKVAFVSDACYNYYQRTNSITKSKRINTDFLDAAYSQMKYLDKKYPNLTIVGHVSYASSALTVYDFYLKNHVNCPKDTMNNIKSIIDENYQYIKVCSYISKTKRAQFYMFKHVPHIYRIIFKLYRLAKRVN
ncbi:MAG: glycosyltransferase [Bifidobacterium sp.]|uniref:glycosyltransferase family 2 protein n=1 Tax=Bifidobacterium sp. TaxID=41200 RepID=UPI00257B38AC|nr:glycosyltransferase [Bifidobacterium sp.]MBS5402038.1 glycosyltransferase [Bifidobacterium sp.]